MLGSYVNIEVDGKELQKIFADIAAAEQTIKDCYCRLARLGVVKFNDPQSQNEVNEVH